MPRKLKNVAGAFNGKSDPYAVDTVPVGWSKWRTAELQWTIAIELNDYEKALTAVGSVIARYMAMIKSFLFWDFEPSMAVLLIIASR